MPVTDSAENDDLTRWERASLAAWLMCFYLLFSFSAITQWLRNPSWWLQRGLCPSGLNMTGRSKSCWDGSRNRKTQQHKNRFLLPHNIKKVTNAIFIGLQSLSVLLHGYSYPFSYHCDHSLHFFPTFSPPHSAQQTTTVMNFSICQHHAEEEGGRHLLHTGHLWSLKTDSSI